MRLVASTTLAVAAVGCSWMEEDAPSSSADRLVSARMIERGVMYLDGVPSRETMEGAFDWSTRTGWAVERGFGPITRTIQIKDACYRRFGRGPWRKSRATDVGGTCSAALFSDPAEEFELIQKVARPKFVGRARIRGVPTKHYRAYLHIGAVEGPIDLWVDDAGVVRRSRQRGPERRSFVTTREYYDFGVRVQVSPPAGAQ